MSVTREMIGAAHDILLKKEMVLSADLLASIYMAMSSRDAEVAELKAENESLLKNLRGKHALTGATYAHLIKERDQLREQVKMLRDALDIAYDHLLVHWTKEELLTVVPLNKIAEALAATDDHHE